MSFLIVNSKGESLKGSRSDLRVVELTIPDIEMNNSVFETAGIPGGLSFGIEAGQRGNVTLDFDIRYNNNVDEYQRKWAEIRAFFHHAPLKFYLVDRSGKRQDRYLKVYRDDLTVDRYSNHKFFVSASLRCIDIPYFISDKYINITTPFEGFFANAEINNDTDVTLDYRYLDTSVIFDFSNAKEYMSNFSIQVFQNDKPISHRQTRIQGVGKGDKIELKNGMIYKNGEVITRETSGGDVFIPPGKVSISGNSTDGVKLQFKSKRYYL